MKSNNALKVVAIMAILFGAATILSGGKALFGGIEARAAVGNAVPFVLWFNFLAGFLYVLTGLGLFLRKPWSVVTSVLLAASTLSVFGAFGLHIAGGGAFEARTVGAMSIRTLFWAMASVVSWRALGGMAGKGGMRSGVLSFLLITIMVFVACNKHSHSDKQEAAPAIESSKPSVNAQTSGEESRESTGIKWQADATTHGGIEKMQQIVTAFDSAAGVETLKEPLGKEFALILERCTMQGEAHDHLHHYLIPLKAKIDWLDNGNGSATLSDLSAYLSTYREHFKL